MRLHSAYRLYYLSTGTAAWSSCSSGYSSRWTIATTDSRMTEVGNEAHT